MDELRKSGKVAISVSELADVIGISEKGAYNLVRRKDFPASFRLGGRWLVSVSKLEEWAREQAELKS